MKRSDRSAAYRSRTPSPEAFRQRLRHSEPGKFPGEHQQPVMPEEGDGFCVACEEHFFASRDQDTHSAIQSFTPDKAFLAGDAGRMRIAQARLNQA